MINLETVNKILLVLAMMGALLIAAQAEASNNRSYVMQFTARKMISNFRQCMQVEWVDNHGKTQRATKGECQALVSLVKVRGNR